MLKKLAARFLFVGLLLITVPAISTSYSAQAGHSTAGGWCQCGCPACACDPGEEPTMCIQSVALPVTDRPRKHTIDFGSLGLIGIVIGTLIITLRRSYA